MGNINISEIALKKIAKILDEIGDYDAIDYVGDFNGNNVFVSSFESETPVFIGYPIYFVVNGDSVRSVAYGEDDYDKIYDMDK